MARGTDFSAKLLQKLTDQRMNCDTHEDHMKQLLQQTLVMEMNFTNEQLETFKTLIDQCIKNDRKFNEKLSNEMLTSMLNMINMENTKLLESHSLMLEMVSFVQLINFKSSG